MIPHAKHRFLHLLVLSVLLCVACGSASLHLGHVDYISDISSIKPAPIQSADEAEKVIKQYSIDFDIPNPLYGSDISFRRMNPNHEDTIKSHVTLLDDTSTEADILYHCFRDSLDAANLFGRKQLERIVLDNAHQDAQRIFAGFREEPHVGAWFLLCFSLR